ncbi:MAG TPA: ATP-binding cassette domain-containing protein [Rhizomicrobium sp.]|jgi:putative ABC transport system ATP-binding protein|nr:ATP-binding cassette domain-containing protein [Rhizomicrobium sp.]
MLASNGAIKLATTDLTLDRGGRAFARVPPFNLSAGEAIALIGASGSGKTTALMAMAAIRAPANGTVRVEDTDPWRLGRRARDRFRGRRIGLVFQSFHLVDALTVRANIWLAAQCAGVRPHDPNHLSRLLDHLGLSSLAGKRADRISQGQAQRVAIARALINKPAVILADEPTSALDDSNTEAMLRLLKESAASEQAALLITTHDKRVLSAVDRVIEMEVLP